MENLSKPSRVCLYCVKLTLVSLLTSIFISFSSSADEKFDKMAKEMAGSFSAPIITSEQLQKEMLSGEIVLLDSRERKEFEVSHLPSATNVGYKSFNLLKTIEKIPKGKKVVVYCSVGYRSGKVAAKLRSKNIRAYNLRGGIFGWVNEGRKVVGSKETPAKKVHGYSWSWSKWLDKGKSVFK